MIRLGIIGGGASGLLAAVIAAKNGAKVTVLEAKDRFGVKLSMTGNGKCNITNTNIEPISKVYYSEDYEFVETVIKRLNPEQLLALFGSWGIETVTRRDGYIYPRSNSAKSVTASLLAIAAAYKVNLKTNCPVTDIIKKDTGYTLYSKSWKMDCDRVIFASGSEAGIKKNKEIDSYTLIQKLNHTVNPLFPALTALKFNDKLLEKLAKNRLEAEAVLYINSKEISSFYGEIQFNKDSISGIPILQLSHYAVLAVYNKKDVFIKLDIYPNEREFELLDRFQKEILNIKGLSFEQFLITKLPKAVISYISEILGVKTSDLIECLDLNKLKKLCCHLKNIIIPISGYNPMESAQVAQGGVCLSEINPDTMESKLLKGLYFCGEVIDVDGYCGGYNLQWAWSSAYIAGNSASKKREELTMNGV